MPRLRGRRGALLGWTFYRSEKSRVREWAWTIVEGLNRGKGDVMGSLDFTDGDTVADAGRCERLAR